MRIAFDVKGTIDGPKGSVILEAFRRLQRLGHTCVVWSNAHSYATEAVEKHGLVAEAMSKKMMLDYGSANEIFDVAIEDDRSQGRWLGAKRFVFVDEIADADSLVNRIIEGDSK